MARWEVPEIGMLVLTIGVLVVGAFAAPQIGLFHSASNMSAPAAQVNSSQDMGPLPLPSVGPAPVATKPLHHHTHHDDR